MKESVSVDQPITKTGLRDITPMLLSIDMMFHFVFNAWMKFRGKPTGQQWNRLLDAVVKIIKYKKTKIDHAIYIMVLYDVTVYYTTVTTVDFLNTNNNDTS